MKVKLFAAKGGEIELTPTEAAEVILIQTTRGTRESNCWKLGDEWELSDGIVKLKKKPKNDNRGNPGIGDQASQRNGDSQGGVSQP